jgi:hypothetical protein
VSRLDAVHRQLAKSVQEGLNTSVPTLEQVEDQVKQLTKAEKEALLDWLTNVMEDELEFTDEFKEKIERGERDIREGRVRMHKP